MVSWFSIFPRNKWLSIYVWIIFCLLPFFFIFRSSSPLEISIGITLMLLYFLSYMFSYKAKNSGLVYMWVSFEIVINILMTLLFGYVYLAIFTAFFIGNIRNPVGFYIIYGLHIAFTVGAIVAGFFIEIGLFLPQIHFILVSVLGTVLLPFNLFYRNKQINLEGQLEHANERISELTVLEERERISRDLHDILGQKLSLIGLKSDLAGRLVFRDPQAAEKELRDIRQTASTALREVRELVADIRAEKLDNELVRTKQMFKAAEMKLTVEGDFSSGHVPAIVESVMSMCLKEAVTNVVKHSGGTACRITFKETPNEYVLTVEDNGIGINHEGKVESGSGLRGMRERLEFVNGSLHIEGGKGTKLTIHVPVVLTHIMKEVD